MENTFRIYAGSIKHSNFIESCSSIELALDSIEEMKLCDMMDADADDMPIDYVISERCCHCHEEWLNDSDTMHRCDEMIEWEKMLAKDNADEARAEAKYYGY